MKQLNFSSDENLNNKINYSKIKNFKRENNKDNNPSIKSRQLSVKTYNNRLRELSKKLSNIQNFSTYNSLIQKGQIKKAGLQTSISNLEKSIKLFKKSKKKKETQCKKLYDEISKLVVNYSIIKKKGIDYDLVKQRVDNENKEIQDIKEETNNINLLIKQMQKEINEMNNNMQIINKKIADETKLSEKIRKDITFYKKHTDNLIQKIKIIYQNSDIIENAINNLDENN